MFNYFLYRFAQFLVVHLPQRAAYGLAVFVSDLHCWLSPRERRWVANNLRIILNSDQDLPSHTREIFRNFSKYLVDFLRMGKINKGNLEDFITVENLHYIDAELKKGRGAIIVSAHMGNWELGGVAMSLLGYPVLVVALEHHSRVVTKFFNNQRNMQGVEVPSFKNAGKRCLEALKDNKVVALVSDRDFSKTGIVAKFFGKDTLFPKGPAVFCRRLNTAIVPGFVVRQDDGRFKLIFNPPIEPIITENEERDHQEITQKCARAIEDYVRRYPDQWSVFREFWIQ
jgi:lauroyl/myristoyl acyltransferase